MPDCGRTTETEFIMQSILPTVIVASILAVILVAIVWNEIRKRKRGQGSCACGGSCGSCNACHRADEKQEPAQEKK